MRGMRPYADLIKKYYIEEIKKAETKEDKIQFLAALVDKIFSIDPNIGFGLSTDDGTDEEISFAREQVTELITGVKYDNSALKDKVTIVCNEFAEILEASRFKNWGRGPESRLPILKLIVGIYRRFNFADSLGYGILAVFYDKFKVMKGIRNGFHAIINEELLNKCGITYPIKEVLDIFEESYLDCHLSKFPNNIITDIYEAGKDLIRASVGYWFDNTTLDKEKVEFILKARSYISYQWNQETQTNEVILDDESIKDKLLKYGVLDKDGKSCINYKEAVDKFIAVLDKHYESIKKMCEVIAQYGTLASEFPKQMCNWLYYAAGEYDDTNVFEYIELDEFLETNWDNIENIKNYLDRLLKTRSVYNEILDSVK